MSDENPPHQVVGFIDTFLSNCTVPSKEILNQHIYDVLMLLWSFVNSETELDSTLPIPWNMLPWQTKNTQLALP